MSDTDARIKIGDVNLGGKDAIVVINEARQRGVYAGEVPSDDKRKMKVALDLVELALDEWYTADAEEWTSAEQGSDTWWVAQDLVAVLHSAGVVPDDDGDLALAAPRGETTRLPEDHPARPKEEPEDDPDDGRAPVVVEGAKTRWSIDQIYQHVVVNGNSNLRFEEGDDAAAFVEWLHGKLTADGEDDLEGRVRAAEVFLGLAGEPQETKTDEPLTPERDDADARTEKTTAEPMEEPWDGYDGQKVAEIVAKLREYQEQGALDGEASEYVRRYELGRKKRTTILTFFDIPEDRPGGHDDLDRQADRAVERDDEREEGDDDQETGTDEAAAETPEAGGDEHPAEEDPPDEGREEVESRGLAGVRDASSARARKILEAEGLPEPPQPSFEEDPELPQDLDSLSHAQVNQLALDFTACLSRATWLHALARINHRDAKRVLDRAEKRALASRASAEDGGKPPAEWRAKAQADAGEELDELREAEGHAKDEVDAWDALVAHYKACYDALSRVEGFRHDEAERAR